MKVIVLVRLVLKLVGALPTLAHKKTYRIYSYLILFIMTANLYAYVILLKIHQTFYINTFTQHL